MPGGFGERVFAAEGGRGAAEGVAGPVVAHMLLRGGLDTTISGIATTLWLLATHPAAVASEVKTRPGTPVLGAFEEALQLRKPDAPRSTARPRNTRAMGGCECPRAGYQGAAADRRRESRSTALAGSDAFDPARRAKQFADLRPRECTTVSVQRIARLEAESLLSGVLVERTESLEIAGEPAWRPVNMLRTLESLPLRIEL